MDQLNKDLTAQYEQQKKQFRQTLIPSYGISPEQLQTFRKSFPDQVKNLDIVDQAHKASDYYNGLKTSINDDRVKELADG